MKVTCTQENFSRSLSYLDRVVGKQSTLPILSNFLLETEKGRLKISATNLEIGVIVSLGAKIEREGKITVPAKILTNFIYNLPQGDVLELEEEGQHLKVVSTGYQIRIKGMDGKDFPIIPQFKKEYQGVLPAQSFKNALSRLLFCVSVNEARLELTGVYMAFFEGKLRMAATDSFRLAEEVFIEETLPVQGIFGDNQSLIIPQGVLQELMRIITPESTEIKVAVEENQVFFDVDGVEVISRLINGKYPDYTQIIPKDFSLQVVFERQELQRAVKIAGALSSYSSGEIALVFDGEQKTCTLLSRSQEVGENRAVLSVGYKTGSDQSLTIVFNPRYVLDGINALSSEKILFCANNATTPAAFRIVNSEEEIDERYLYLMMPIRK
jgi:DNA polymerase-3 subunit beta